MTRKASAPLYVVCSKTGLNAITPTATDTMKIATVSTFACHWTVLADPALHNTIAGATTNAPARSPIHHVSHIEKNFDQTANPTRVKLKTPTVALTMVVGAKL